MTSPAAAVLRGAIIPALDLLSCWQPGCDTPDARRMMLAISGQEAAWLARRQAGNGPARGLWQFERGGGVAGVLSHPATKSLARKFCEARSVAPFTTDVYEALERDDVLAAGFARLLLLTDPKPMPSKAADGWACYLRNWRPGKPRQETWAGRWAAAEAEMAYW